MDYIQENKAAEAVATPCLTALRACQSRRYRDLVEERLSGSQAFNPAHLAKLLRTEYFDDTLPILFVGFGRQKEFVEQLNAGYALAGYITFDEQNR